MAEDNTRASRSWFAESIARVSSLAWPVLPPRDEREPHLLRNSVAILGFDFVWGIAMSFFFYATVLTGCLKTLRASPLLIALVPGLFWGMYSLIQPLSTFWVRPVRGRHRLTLGFYSICGVSYVLLGALLLWLPEAFVQVRIAAIFLCMITFISGCGLGDPHYVALMMETIRPRWRSRFFAAKGAAVGIGGLIGSYLYNHLMRALPPVSNYGFSILAGGLLEFGAVVVWGFFCEQEPLESKTGSSHFPTYLRHMFQRFRGTAGFGWFVLAAGLFVGSAGVVGFSNTYVRDVLRASEKIDGALTISFAASSLVGSFVFGMLASAWGFRRTLAIGCLTITAGLALLLCADVGVSGGAIDAAGLGLWLGLGGYFVASLWLSAMIICLFNLCVSIAPNWPPAEAAAAMSFSLMPFQLLEPAAAGYVMSRFPGSGRAVLTAAAATACLGAALLLWRVKEPPEPPSD